MKDTILHDYIYCSILDKCKHNHIQLSRLLYYIKTIVRIPKSMDKIILKELEDSGYIKRINHQTYYIFRKSNNCKRSVRRIKKYKDFAFW